MTRPEEHVLVIIAAYNQSAFLEEAIESVLSQDYPHVKTVIVDDGSTDETQRVCKAYLEKYSDRIVYEYQENRGCASARNRGLDFIKEDTAYVCFLDSDDRLMPGKIGREVALLRTHPDAMFAYADAILYDENTGLEKRRKVAAAGKPEDFAILHFLTNEAKSAALLYRAEVFKNQRFREDMRYNEDSEFLQRIAIECKGVYAPQPSAWVRHHAKSKSRNRIEIQKAELEASLSILKRYPGFHRSFTRLADQRIEQIRKRLFAELVLRGCWDEARRLAKGGTERFVVTCHLRPYGAISRSLGSLLRKRPSP